jgi:hypothetical protein
MLSAPGCDLSQYPMENSQVIGNIARVGVSTKCARLAALRKACSSTAKDIVPPAEHVVAGSDSNAAKIVNLAHCRTTDIVGAAQQTATDIVSVTGQSAEQRQQNSANAACCAGARLECVVVASRRKSLRRKRPHWPADRRNDLRTFVRISGSTPKSSLPRPSFHAALRRPIRL